MNKSYTSLIIYHSVLKSWDFDKTIHADVIDASVPYRDNQSWIGRFNLRLSHVSTHYKLI